MTASERAATKRGTRWADRGESMPKMVDSDREDAVETLAQIETYIAGLIQDAATAGARAAGIRVMDWVAKLRLQTKPQVCSGCNTEGHNARSCPVRRRGPIFHRCLRCRDLVQGDAKVDNRIGHLFGHFERQGLHRGVTDTDLATNYEVALPPEFDLSDA